MERITEYLKNIDNLNDSNLEEKPFNKKIYEKILKSL